MAIDYEIISKISRIATGGEYELSRGSVAEQMIDIDDYTKFMIKDKADRAKKFYEELIKDDTKILYDLDKLDADIADMKKSIDAYLEGDEGETVFERMYDSIERLFVSPPFEGLDDIPYGIGEMCVFSVLEYFTVKKYGYDHEDLRKKYKDSIASRTEAGSSDYWINVYDMLQKRYEGLTLDQCSQMAVAAMRVQNEEYFDAIRKNAEKLEEPSVNARIVSEFVAKNIG